MHTYHSGGEGKITFSGVDYCVNDASMTDSIDEVDTTTTCDFDTTDNILYGNRLAVRRNFEGNFKFFWDSDAPPVPAIKAGATGTLVMTFPGGKTFSGTVMLTSIPFNSGGMSGAFGVEVTWKNMGKCLFA